MVSLSSGSRYYLWREPVDMRKSFDGLHGLVTGQMGRDALSGEVFIFMNRRRDQVKMLVWDRSGFVIYYKRLERGRFELPALKEACRGQVLPWADLMLIMEGVSLQSVRWRKRYVRPGVAAAQKQKMECVYPQI